MLHVFMLFENYDPRDTLIALKFLFNTEGLVVLHSNALFFFDSEAREVAICFEYGIWEQSHPNMFPPIFLKTFFRQKAFFSGTRKNFGSEKTAQDYKCDFWTFFSLLVFFVKAKVNSVSKNSSIPK